MFPHLNWLERHLSAIGLWMFLAGILLLIIGSVGETLSSVANASSARSWPPVAGIFWRVVSGLAHPLIYNGVVLYLVGRLMGAWTISVVGFDHSDGDTLRLKGPDERNTVWIGRRYEAVLDAEAAAHALQRRFRKDEEQR